MTAHATGAEGTSERNPAKSPIRNVKGNRLIGSVEVRCLIGISTDVLIDDKLVPPKK